MNAVIDTAIARSRTVFLVLALVLIAGIFAYVSIPKESDPDVNIPIIYVSVGYEGISPEDAERLLARPLERELRSIEGVKELRSTSTQGFASVLLEFDAGFNADNALADVREQVDIAKNELPTGTEDPVIHEVNVGLFPVLVVMLSGSLPERALLEQARDLQDTLEGLPGVLSANIVGDRKELLEILVDPMQLESHQISPKELFEAVDLNNRLVAAGALDTGAGRFPVKVPGLFRSVQDALNLPVKTSGDSVIRLSDVSEIRRTFVDSTTYARLDGRSAVAIEIRKRLGFNVIETINDVRQVAEERSQNWPKNLELTFIQDQSDNIRSMLKDLQNNIITAVMLVMIVVLAALGIRSSILVGLAIPGSFLIGVLYLYLFGMTMNIVVLFSLILVVGMLVDGAIVVTEFADRKMAEGKPRRNAYSLAAKRMAWPIIASTATTLAAFMPLLFWPGVVGEFMKFLPITLIVTLSGSLLMALVFVPSLGGQIGAVGTSNTATLHRLALSENGDLSALNGFTGMYARTLSWLIARTRRIAVIVTSAITLLIGIQIIYAEYGNGIEFFPHVEPENAIVLIHARGNMSTDEKDALVREVEERVFELKHEFDGIYASTGASAEGQQQSEDVIGTILLELKPWRDRRKAQFILDDLRQRTSNIPGIVVEMREPDVGPPTGKDIRIEVSSLFPESIPAAVDTIRTQLSAMEGLIDIEDSRPTPGIEWELQVDRAQASRFGADIFTVGTIVQFVTNGVKLGEYQPNDAHEQIDIRIRFPIDKRSMSQLDLLRVPTLDGNVPISNFVSRKAKPKVATIERVNERYVHTIQANVTEGTLTDNKVREIAEWFQEAYLPPEISVSFKGKDEEQKKASSFLSKAFGAALFIMAIILVTQFNSFYHAFLILTSVIMSTIGVMMGLLVTGQPFGIVMTGVGIITLAGIVVNNNIVLIDTFARLRNAGMDPYEAIIRTGVQRLRPVLLTAVTTVCGLMPMVLALNIDFATRDIVFGAPSTQWWTQLSTAVASGLTFATLLTLVVTPSLLAVGVKSGQWYATKKERNSISRTQIN